MEFKSSPKIYDNYKSAFPEETISRIEDCFKKIGLKIDYHDRKVEKAGTSIYVGMIYRQGKYLASGKGTSKELCKASALAELVERILARWTSVPPEKMIKDADSILAKPPKRGGYKRRIKARDFFKEFPQTEVDKIKVEDDYIDAYSLVDDEYFEIPHSFVKKISRSNGLSAGNTLEEALSHGFCEVCERYSLIKHLRDRIPAKSIREDSFKNQKIRDLIKLFKFYKIDAQVKDLTMAGRFPVMGVLFTNNNVKDSGKLVKEKNFKNMTVGAGFNLEEAIIRCFTEYIQVRGGKDIILPSFLHYSVGNKEYSLDFLSRYYSDKESELIINNFKKKGQYVPLFRRNATFENFSFLNDKETLSFDDLKIKKTSDFLEDIDLIKEISRKNNWKSLIIDYSSDAFPLKVVRVVVPSVSDLLGSKYVNKIPEDFSLFGYESYGDVYDKMNEMNPIDQFNFFKFNILPEAMLPYEIILDDRELKDHNMSRPKAIEFLLEKAENANLKKEVEKIKGCLRGTPLANKN